MRFCYRQSNVRRLLPASDYSRARSNQIVAHSSDNEAVLGSSRKLGGPSEHLIDQLTAAENTIAGRPSNFRVRMLLKSAVIQVFYTSTHFEMYLNIRDTFNNFLKKIENSFLRLYSVVNHLHYNQKIVIRQEIQEALTF